MVPLFSKYLTRKRYERVLPHVRGEVLDLGCGYSVLARTFDNLPRYVGVDQAEAPLSYLRSHHPNYEFVQRDLNNDLLLLDSKFDTIVMSAIIEHLKNPEHIISQLPEYLKVDGTVLLTTPTPFGGLVHTLGAYVGLFYREAQQEHEAFFDLQDLRRLFEQNGLYVAHYERFLLGGNQLVIGKLKTDLHAQEMP